MRHAPRSRQERERNAPQATYHFNGLTEAEAERLADLAEECGEVIQAIGKILRHGYESDNHGKLWQTNRQQLEREIADVLYTVDMLVVSGDVDRERCQRERSGKSAEFYHHQEVQL